ncbi:MAG: hypothetical protein ACI8RD_005475 [Bacillariaceae sp.]|jgi:hypothetical protein
MMMKCNLCLALLPLRSLLLLLIILHSHRNYILSSSFQVIRIEEQQSSRDNVVVVITRDVTSATTEEQQECDSNEQYDYLSKARKLIPPPVESIENGDIESIDWWMEHSALLQRAWIQWHQQQKQKQQQKRLLLPLNVNSITIDPNLHRDVYQTWKEPTLENEERIHRKWEEVLLSTTTKTILNNDNENIKQEQQQQHHKVFRYQNFLTPEGIKVLRNNLDSIKDDSGIPTRRPNAMNRNGLLLDPTVPGGVGGNLPIHNFLDNLVRDFVRPLGRSFFPTFCGNPEDDIKYYAFTIRYGDDGHDPLFATGTGGDVELKEHSDASIISLNINLNLPNEEYTGSSIYFVQDGEKEENKRELKFESGTALLHRGMTRHGSIPLKSGQRNNLVIWLHGKDGYVRISPYEEHERLTIPERWSFI